MWCELPALEGQVTSTHSNLWNTSCINEEVRTLVKVFVNGFIVLLQLNHRIIVLLQPMSNLVPKQNKLV